jgi:ATP-dependent DNA ligase
MKWFNVLEKIENIGSLNEKQKILERYKEKVYPAFKAALSDDAYHITSKQIFKKGFDPQGDYKAKNLPRFLKLLDLLSNRAVTGGEAVHLTSSILNGVSPDEAEWMLRILDKKLRVGVSIKQIKKTWGEEAIDDIRPRDFLFMKAVSERPLDPAKVYSIEPKFDGQRMAYIYDGLKDETKAVSLEGGDYTSQFQPILKRLRRAARKNGWFHLVMDSETIARDFTWNSTRKLLSKGRGVNGITIDESEFRKSWGNVAIPSIGHESTRRCPSVRISGKDTKKLERLKAICISKGLEGVVSKDLDSLYEEGKKKAWIKGKMEEDTLDVKIVGYEEGKARSRNKGRLGALICENPKTKERFKVGAFKDRQRKVFWKYRHILPDVFIEIRRQNDGVAKARFPEYERLRLDKTKKYAKG